MSTFLLLTVLVVGVEPRSATASGDPGREEAEARRLIAKLGSESFAEREEASKGLAAMGSHALAALKAARNSPDPEVRRRASKLAKTIEEKVKRRQIEAIKTSKLMPHEKGRMLKAFIAPGMSKQEIKQLLGKYHPWSFQTPLHKGEVLEYERFGLNIVLSSTWTPEGWTPQRVIYIDNVGP